MTASQLKILPPHDYFGNRRDYKSQQIKPRWEHLFIRSFLQRRRKMARLLSFVVARPQFASPKSALLVENDKSLLNYLTRCLKDEGYAVRIAANSDEGLRLYRDYAPFDVVLIDYYVPQIKEFKIDLFAPRQTNGTALAIAIREIKPSQRMIIAALGGYWNASEVQLPREVMHIPVLIDILKLHSLLERIEVEQAIEALTSSELLRLQQFADFRIRGLGRAARGRTGEDLLSEAQFRTLKGAGVTREGRHWNKHVDFVWHLTGAMRSISNGWKRQFTEKEAYLISEVSIHDAEGQEHSPLDNLVSEHKTADQRLIEKDKEEWVLSKFKDDPEATQVLQGLLDGLKKNEIMSKYGLSEKQYAAAVKRIRVTLLS
jgi:CheY-like chemotaxis protein